MKKSFISSVLSVVATVVLTFAVTAVVTTSTASARCADVGKPYTTTLEYGGAVIVTEAPDSGTCKNNNVYNGTFRSNVAGWRASVWIQNNGAWTAYAGGYNTNPHGYNFSDNNSHVYMMLCADNGGAVRCGYGPNVAIGTYPNFPATYLTTNQGF